MSDRITLPEVKKIAQLARLSLTDQETGQYARELSAILEYVGELDKVDTEGVEATSQVTGLSNVLRPDEAVPFGNMEELINMAPEHEDNLIKVKAVFEK